MTEVQKAGALVEVTREALDAAADDLRAVVRADLTRKLAQLAPVDSWIGGPTFAETDGVRTVGIYADDADWDDEDNPPEPIGYEDVPMVVMRATVRFPNQGTGS